MPSSVSGRLISGSWTVASAALMASSAGVPVSVSVIGACVSFDGGPGPAVGLRTAATCAIGSPATVRRATRGAAGRRVICCAPRSEVLRPATPRLGAARAGGLPGRTDAAVVPLRTSVAAMTTMLRDRHHPDLRHRRPPPPPGRRPPLRGSRRRRRPVLQPHARGSDAAGPGDAGPPSGRRPGRGPRGRAHRRAGHRGAARAGRRRTAAGRGGRGRASASRGRSTTCSSPPSGCRRSWLERPTRG